MVNIIQKQVTRDLNLRSLDYYPTPAWCTRSLLDFLENKAKVDEFNTCWEPAAGGGHMIKVLEEKFNKVYASDIYDHRNIGFRIHDFSSGRGGYRSDWIITNPPFKLGEEFTIRALRKAVKGVAMLCRIQWVESNRRYENLFNPHPPSYVVVYPVRLNLYQGKVLKDDRGGVICYAWYIWIKDRKKPTQLHWFSTKIREQFEREGDYELMEPTGKKGGKVIRQRKIW